CVEVHALLPAGNPDTSPLAGSDVRRPDRPRTSVAMRVEVVRFLGQHMNEGDPLAVRGGGWRPVVVATGTEPDDGSVSEIVDTDQRVVVSMAHERDALTVRRPGQRIQC